ncbi:hypothetical protein HY087_02950 [Candidatus Gottesmanbacteria bacterium]|nr:hypothetical protein [Candidatus Gottesmanbacteria bacterium]MBI3560059.1 hypothetical protein [Candidatus Gottesmanbacteria bacterium]
MDVERGAIASSFGDFSVAVEAMGWDEAFSALEKKLGTDGKEIIEIEIDDQGCVVVISLGKNGYIPTAVSSPLYDLLFRA